MAIIDLDKNEIISKLKADNKNLAKINNKPLQIKRGNKANLPQLADGELAFVKDEERIYVGKNGEKNVPMANYEELFDMSQEVENARTGYFGKEHASLQDRLNDEFQFVTVDNSRGMYVEQSTLTSSMKIENSIEGRARDTVVKGRTLQNLGGTKRVDMSNSHNRTLLFSTSYPLKASDIYFLHFTLDITNPLDGTNALKIFFKNIDGENFNYYSTGIVTSGDYILKLDRFSFNGNVKDIIGVGMYFEDKPINAGMRVSIKDVMVLSTNTEQHYFEGIKSLGEEDNNRISILSGNETVITDYNLITEKGLNPDGTLNTNLGANVIDFFYVGKGSLVYLHNCSYYVYSDDGINPTGSRMVVTGEIKSSHNYIRTVYVKTNNIKITLKDKQDKKDILLPSTVTNGSKGIENVCDETHWNGDYLQKIEGEVLDSNKNWYDVKNNGVIYGFGCTLSKVGINKLNAIISNRFTTVNDEVESIRLGNSGSSVFIFIDKSKLETADVAGFKKWLQNNPTTVYYELATPILHKANPVQNNNLTTFKDITHVSCLNKIAPSEMSAKFPVDTIATISRLNRENKEQEIKNIELKKENVELNEKIINQAIYFDEQTVDLATVDFETDFRLMEIEFALDIPINLNMKGMMNMAVRTPYDMAKIVILGGNYERADMEYKLSVYVKRGRMTQEEHDELIALMDAQEIVEK